MKCTNYLQCRLLSNVCRLNRFKKDNIKKVSSFTFDLKSLSAGVQVCHLPLHRPSPVEIWWFKFSLNFKKKKKQQDTSDRFIMRWRIVFRMTCVCLVPLSENVALTLLFITAGAGLRSLTRKWAAQRIRVIQPLTERAMLRKLTSLAIQIIWLGRGLWYFSAHSKLTCASMLHWSNAHLEIAASGGQWWLCDF